MYLFNLFVLFGLLATTSCISFFSVFMEEWEAFKLLHSKKYDSHVEESFRMKIYAENKHKIAKHNKLHSLGNKTYSLKMNKYGDMLHREFVDTMNGLKNFNLTYVRELREKNACHFIGPDETMVTLPKTVDWRTQGAVTPVKDQGACGSCWAFSSTGSLEGQHFRKTGKLVSLSEQNLVDCSTKFGNNGCNGGLMDYAFEYVKENGGIDTETSYPYEAADDRCQFNRSTIGADDKGYMDIRQGSEKALKKAVATVGPIAVAIDASHSSFQFYHDGVYYEPECDSEALDHGVLAVGYGFDEDSRMPYWLVKNSWGTTWGNEGYIRMARHRNNMCGIASSASYPLV